MTRGRTLLFFRKGKIKESKTEKFFKWLSTVSIIFYWPVFSLREKFVDLCKTQKRKFFQKRLDKIFKKVFHRQKIIFFFFCLENQGFPQYPQSFPQGCYLNFTFQNHQLYFFHVLYNITKNNFLQLKKPHFLRLSGGNFCKYAGRL